MTPERRKQIEQEARDRYPDYPFQSVTTRERAAYIAGRTAAEEEIERLKAKNKGIENYCLNQLDGLRIAFPGNEPHPQIEDFERLLQLIEKLK